MKYDFKDEQVAQLNQVLNSFPISELGKVQQIIKLLNEAEVKDEEPITAADSD